MTRRTSSLFARPTDESGRRVQATVFLPRLTTEEGEWLAKVLPALQRRARPEPQAVRVEDVALRYRSGRLGIAVEQPQQERARLSQSNGADHQPQPSRRRVGRC